MEPCRWRRTLTLAPRPSSPLLALRRSVRCWRSLGCWTTSWRRTRGGCVPGPKPSTGACALAAEAAEAAAHPHSHTRPHLHALPHPHPHLRPRPHQVRMPVRTRLSEAGQVHAPCACRVHAIHTPCAYQRTSCLSPRSRPPSPPRPHPHPQWARAYTLGAVRVAPAAHAAASAPDARRGELARRLPRRPLLPHQPRPRLVPWRACRQCLRCRRAQPAP